MTGLDSSPRRGEREQRLAGAIGKLGVWDAGLCFAPVGAACSAAAELEAAGYQAVWLHEGGRHVFAAAAILLAHTRRIVVGTSIASIWQHEPTEMVTAARTLGEAFPGRFVLGLGVSHEGARSWRGRAYGRPLDDLSDYLDEMEGVPWPCPRPQTPVPRMIGALGPRMLELARRRTRGAIPYLVPVEHTSFARGRLGRDPVLAVQQAIVIDQPLRRARELAHEHVQRYLPFPNYRNNLLRCGFTDRDLQSAGSERLVNALVAIGDLDDVAARAQGHLDAGADHVCVNPLGRARDEIPLADLQQLAGRLVAPEVAPVDSRPTKEEL
ncbi:MAG: TIGR03620 family F420-dependent LLM class oxidoreductase [Solirubrobacteraceae bacterium]